MAQITILYNLTDAGRKALLLAGGNGARGQRAVITDAHPRWLEAAGQARVAETWRGNESDLEDLLVISLLYGPEWWFDAVPTLDQLLDRPGEVAAARAAAITEATLRVLADRVTRREQGDEECATGGRSYVYAVPAWPCDRDPAVVASPAAVAWIEELAAAREATRLALHAAERRAAEEARAATDLREAAEAAMRARRGLVEGECAFAIRDGALIEAPVWEHPDEGRSWFAVITPDPTRPSGLARAQATVAHGPYYYLLPALAPGDAVEFAADPVICGHRMRIRWYGHVLRIALDRQDPELSYLVLAQAADGHAAITAGRKAAATVA